MKFLLIIYSFIFLSTSNFFSCTLWSSIGESSKDNITLIAKNRDWIPDQKQILKKILASINNYAYFGIYAEGDDEPGFKAGINEKGLVVITASASSIPKKKRVSIKNNISIIKTLLSNYSSVSDVIKDKKIFNGKKPTFYMIADKNDSAYIEISIDGKFSIHTVNNGILYHTNHFLDENFSSSNIKIGKSSLARYQRIEQLLTNNNTKLTMDDFKKFSNDKNDGPDNSIFRTGSKPKSERTLATWIVSIPKNDSPTLYIKLLNPGESVQEINYVINDDFWKS